MKFYEAKADRRRTNSALLTHFIFWRDIRQSTRMSKKKVSFSWAFKEFIWPRKKIIFIGLILSNIKYSNKKHNSFLIASIFKTIFLFPLMIFQYQKSKSDANKMISAGAKIKFDI